MTHPQFWAEDAVVFYADAERLGASSLLAPYAGYFHAAPRIVALVGRAVPVAWLPTFYLWSALALMYGGLCLSREAHAELRPIARWVATLTPLLVPFSQEILAALTNVQWVLALTLVAAYMAKAPRSRTHRMAWMAMLALAVLTGPFALILFPAAVLAYVYRRDRWSFGLVCAQGAAACLMVLPLLSGRQLTTHAAGLSIAEGVMRALSDRPRLVLSCLSFAALLSGLLLVGVWRRRLRVAAPAACGVLVLLATMIAGPAELLAAFPTGGGRYLFIPWVCMAWSLLALLPTARVLVIVALSLMMAVTARFYRFAPLPRYDWPAAAECLERSRFCETTIIPGWKVGLPGRGPAEAKPR